jgi:hypothetical protein
VGVVPFVLPANQFFRFTSENRLSLFAMPWKRRNRKANDGLAMFHWRELAMGQFILLVRIEGMGLEFPGVSQIVLILLIFLVLSKNLGL